MTFGYIVYNYFFIKRIPTPTTAELTRINTDMGEKLRKGKGSRNRAIDALIGDEEQKKEKKAQSGPQPRTIQSPPTTRRNHTVRLFFLLPRPTGEYIYILLRCSLSRQNSKVQYHWVVRRRGQTRKHGKVEVTRKWWVLAHPPYSPEGNGRESPRVEPRGQTTGCGGKPREPVASKAGKTSKNECAFQIHSYKK